MVLRNSSPFGSRSRTLVLVALSLLVASYARELARVLAIPLYSIQQALKSLERDGLVAARSIGRTRAYRINPRYFAKTELETFLRKLSETEPQIAAAANTLRRRPRRTGKKL